MKKDNCFTGFEFSANRINGLKFEDCVEKRGDSSLNLDGFITKINNSIDVLYGEKPEADLEKIDLHKNIIIDSIYCCYIASMRNELTYGTASNSKFQLEELQDRMFNIANQTSNEFMKLQTGFVSILISYIDRNS